MIGRRLERLRIAKELSQSEVARALNLTQQAIDNYEKGAREPKGSILVRLAQFYGVTTDYLLGRTEESAGQEEPAGAALPVTDDEELIVVFRGRRQDLSPNYKKALIALLEEAHRKMEDEEK